MAKPLNIVVACSENRVIGRAGQLPWRILEDWHHFKRLTAESTVILGRISFESWKSIHDAQRHAIVLSRNQALAGPRVSVADSLNDALVKAQAPDLPRSIFICGGQRIFEEAVKLPQVERLFLTLVHAQLEGDRTFPEWKNEFPRRLERRDGSDQNFSYSFYTLARQ